jgi:hypothetical protein
MKFWKRKPRTWTRPRRLPDLRIAVRWLMIAAGLCFGLSLCLGAGSLILLNLPIDGQGTIYSKDYDETKFQGLRTGMTAKEVEAIMGQPLRIIPLNQHQGIRDEELWHYSEQPDPTADFWRRWVEFKAGRMTRIISDYWYD